MHKFTLFLFLRKVSPITYKKFKKSKQPNADRLVIFDFFIKEDQPSWSSIIVMAASSPPDRYVLASNRFMALRVFSSQYLAGYIAGASFPLAVVVRTGDAQRCLDYCMECWPLVFSCYVGINR